MCYVGLIRAYGIICGSPAVHYVVHKRFQIARGENIKQHNCAIAALYRLGYLWQCALLNQPHAELDSLSALPKRLGCFFRPFMFYFNNPKKELNIFCCSTLISAFLNMSNVFLKVKNVDHWGDRRGNKYHWNVNRNNLNNSTHLFFKCYAVV